MGLIFPILVVVLLAMLLWVVAQSWWQLATTLPRLLRRLRFGIFDLFFLLTVLGVCLGLMRASWNSPYFGYALLVPVVAPLAWFIRFAIDDFYARRARRAARRAAVLSDPDHLTDKHEESSLSAAELEANRSRRRRLWMPRRSNSPTIPHLSPYSLSERPLDEE